jgi:uncharacterized protein YbaP (TraB family)
MEFEDIFLTKRNKKWIPQILEYTTDQSCFIAVGAAHLFDDNGILNLLEKEGFKTTAIKK